MFHVVGIMKNSAKVTRIMIKAETAPPSVVKNQHMAGVGGRLLLW